MKTRNRTEGEKNNWTNKKNSSKKTLSSKKNSTTNTRKPDLKKTDKKTSISNTASQKGRYGTTNSSQELNNKKTAENLSQKKFSRSQLTYNKIKSQKVSDKQSKPHSRKNVFQQKHTLHKKTNPVKPSEELIRLNKYLANAGICSRREADKLIQTGAVSVNGQIITELGYKVKPTDKVVYGGEKIKAEKKVYILLNKPKDYITTTDDPQERKTVMDLIKGACKERIYPVGRLDRNTTGVLLLTNDGELAKKLLHPKHGIPKIYHVTLDKNISREDMESLFNGIELEDGFTKVDNIAYASPAKTKKEVGVEIHSGKNRIVRRMFEHLGYKVVKLDRVSFAGLTKKDLPRGKYRFLTEKEIGFLHMIS